MDGNFEIHLIFPKNPLSNDYISAMYISTVSDAIVYADDALTIFLCLTTMLYTDQYAHKKYSLDHHHYAVHTI